jgi:YbbR domain-containing protein
VASLREYLKRDGLLLLAALLLAVLVWNYVNDELTETLTVWPRLELQVPEGLTLSKGAPTEIKVVLRGTRRSLGAVDAAKLTVRYRLPDRPGPAEVALRHSDFALPPGVEVYEFPERFEVGLEQVEKKKVPVRVEIVGSPQAGFVVSGVPLSEPGEVEISGRREIVESIAQVRTQAVDLNGKNRFFSANFRLAVPPEVQCQPESVLVSVDIGVEPVTRDISGVDVRALVPSGFDMRVRVDPALVTVKLRGAPAVLTGLDLNPREIVALADLSGLTRPFKAESFEVPVRLVLPPGVVLAPGTTAPRVRVQIGEK